MLKRIIYLILIFTISSCETENRRPNIVFILTDDLGFILIMVIYHHMDQRP